MSIHLIADALHVCDIDIVVFRAMDAFFVVPLHALLVPRVLLRRVLSLINDFLLILNAAVFPAKYLIHFCVDLVHTDPLVDHHFSPRQIEFLLLLLVVQLSRMSVV